MSILQNKDIYDPSQGDPFKPIKEMLTVLGAEIDKVKKSLSGMENAIKQVNQTGNGAEAKALTENVSKLANETNKLTALQKAELNIKKQLETAETKLTASYSDTSQQLRNIQLIQQKATKEQKEALKLNSLLTGEYEKQSITLNKLRQQYKDIAAAEKANTKEAKDLLSEINKLDTKLKDIDAIVGQHQRKVGQYENALKGWTGAIKNFGSELLSALGIGSAIGTIVSLLSSAFNTIKEFSSKVSELQAITGASGNDLEYLKNSAAEMASVYGKSASSIVEAMKLVGSAKPELLENVRALTSMTEAVLILSKASGQDLAATTENLAVIMNQFGHNSAMATEDINILAAGSKYGSVEVDYLANSIKKVGSIANSAGLTLQQTVAVMELFGEKGIAAEVAGTGFRNVLVKLQSDTKNYKNGVFDLNLAIENNKNISNDNIKLQQKFGTEFFNLAQILFQGQDRFNQLTSQVTGTNTALEQASIATNNLSGDMDKASGAWDRFVLSLEKGDGIVSKVLRGVVKTFTLLTELQAIVNSNNGAVEYAKKFKGLENESDKIAIRHIKKIESITNAEDKQKALRDDLIRTSILMRLQEDKLSSGVENGKPINDARIAQLKVEIEVYKTLLSKLNEYKQSLIGDGTSDKSNVSESSKPNSAKKKKASDKSIPDYLDRIKLENEKWARISDLEKEALAGEKAYNDNLLAMQEANSQAVWDMKIADAEREQELRDEKLQAEKEYNEKIKATLGETMAYSSEQFGQLLAEGNLSFQNFGKLIISTALDVAQKMILISLAEIFANEIKSKSFVGLVTFPILSGLVTGFFNGVKSQVAKLATGTEYVSGPGSGTSDSIPAMLSKGERVVPEKYNKMLSTIPNSALPELVQKGMNYARLEGLVCNMISEQMRANQLLSRGRNDWSDEKFLYSQDWNSGIIKKMLKNGN